MQRVKSKPKSFRDFWDKSLHDGVVEVSPQKTEAKPFSSKEVALIHDAKTTGGYCLALYSKIGMTDSRHAHNPWLQELPDPVTKVVWDNYVCISKKTADELNVSDGDLLKVATKGSKESIELPTLVQRGQDDRTISIALGYGVLGTDRFAEIGPQWFEARPTVEKGKLVGKNVASFIKAQNGSRNLVQNDITLTKTGKQHELAKTQEYHSLEMPKHIAPYGAEVRDSIVQHTSLAAFAKNAAAGKHANHFEGEPQLWPEDHKKTGHEWGMTIDLNACTGCSACLVACQSENNVPVVGKDEVRRQREMHWLRIDRYFGGEEDDVQVSHQPMMCQHCGNAPCETVCPVLATTHSSEGLNEQVYNRCVGTRYCANNCPYKVRRFNWFEYPHKDTLQNLALNPDIAVRTRGVMEKCSMCVQRIEDEKIDAQLKGESLADGAIKTACQQSCPAQAISFGDLNNSKSKIHESRKNKRGYKVLEEFNFRESVTYLRIVKNRDEGEGEKSHHNDKGHAEMKPLNSKEIGAKHV